MSAAATARTAPGRGAASPGAAQPWAGTGTLLRFYLRLDRVRITVWAVAIGVFVAASIASFEATYPTPESLAARAGLMSNPATIMMTGPAFGLDDYTFGAMVANELSLYIYLAAAIMSILLVVRHTRAEEESGRMEMLRALPVGRFAPPAAAVLTVALADVTVGAAVTAALVGTGMAVPSSIALGLGTTLTGLVLAAVAAVTAQLTEHARGATGIAMAVLAVAFLVRGIGDVIDNQGSWLSWLSPFAWAQQTRLYVDLRWWPLAVSALVTLVLLAIAVSLAQRRDLGAGLRQPRPGPATAAPGLLSPAGVARRLLRASFLSWAVGTFLFAVAFGSLASSLEDAFADIPELGDWIEVSGADLTSGFAAAILSFLAIAAVIFAVSGVLRLRAEEEAGRVEELIVTGSSRGGLLGGWLAVVGVQTMVLLAVVGLGTGIGVWFGTGDARWVGELTVAGLVYAPATMLVAAVAVLLYAAVPRRTGLAWLLVTWVALALFLGTLLNLPGWAMDLSPFSHTPAVPDADLEALPLAVMTALVVVLVGASFAAFRRRDVVPG